MQMTAVNSMTGLTTVTKEGRKIDPSASVHFFLIPEVAPLRSEKQVTASYLQKIIESGRQDESKQKMSTRSLVTISPC